MEKKYAILNYLYQWHVGQANAISGLSLGRVFGVSDRTIYRYVSDLRYDGYPVRSCHKGYYYRCDSPADAKIIYFNRVAEQPASPRQTNSMDVNLHIQLSI